MKSYMREIKYFVRSNYLLYGLSILVISLTAITISFTCFLIFTTVLKENIIKSQFEGNSMIRVIDNLYEDYSDFTSSSANIDKIGNFYNALNEDKNLDFLAVTSQPIFIKDFQSKSRTFIEEGTGAAPGTVSIKSIQLNKDAFNFYHIQASSGNIFDWDTINAEDSIIPILMGSEYQDVYQIDDVLEGYYYRKPATFKVIGYIKKNTSIYYNQEAEFYIDNFILVPYPTACSKTLNDDADIEFKRLSYLNMINGNVVSSTLNDKGIMSALDKASYLSGFNRYSILGQPNFSKQLSQMVTIMQENQSLFIIMLTTLILFAIVTQTFINYEIAKKRYDIHTLYWDVGKLDFYKELSIIQWIPYMIAFILTLVFIVLFFEEGLIIGIIASILIFILLKFICDICSYQLIKRST